MFLITERTASVGVSHPKQLSVMTGEAQSAVEEYSREPTWPRRVP